MTLGFLKKRELDTALDLLDKAPQRMYFEQVSDLLQKKYHKDVKLVNSGSEALYRVFIHIKPQLKKKRILMPAYTCYAPVKAAITAGLKVVLVDVNNNFGIDVNLCKKAENVGAILVVHPYGIPLDMKQLREVAEDKSSILIEDFAQSYGAKIGNKNVGTFGHYSILSFRFGKHIFGITGGAILSEEKVYTGDRMLAKADLESPIRMVKRMLDKTEHFAESIHAERRSRISQSLGTFYSLSKKVGKAYKISLKAYLHRPNWEEGIMGEVQAYLAYTQLTKGEKIVDGRNMVAEKILSYCKKPSISKPEIRADSSPSFIAVPLLCEKRSEIEKTLTKNRIRYEKKYNYSNVRLFPFLKRIGGKNSTIIPKKIITFSTDPYDAFIGNYDGLERVLAN